MLDGLVLIDLLKILRDRGPLQDEAGTHYEIIVDTLAAGGIVGARELQQRDE